MISNALEDRPLPVYGDGMQIRDWLYVDDHCRGILAVLRQGRPGEIYNIGGNRSLPNLEVVRQVLALTGKPESLIQYVDRPARARPPLCALRARNSCAKPAGSRAWISKPASARPSTGTAPTPGWVARVRSGAYRAYYEENYGGRAIVPSLIGMRVAIEAASLALSSGGLARYTGELSLALARGFPDDEFFLVSDQPFALPPELRPICAAAADRAMPGSAAGGCGAWPARCAAWARTWSTVPISPCPTSPTIPAS